MAGKPYGFSEHAVTSNVCSYAKKDLAGLKRLQAQVGGELPTSVCEKKACVVEALRSGGDAKARCGL